MQMVDISHIMVTTHLKFDLQQLTWLKEICNFDFNNLSINQCLYNCCPSVTHMCVCTSNIQLSNFDSNFICKLKRSKWNHYRIIIAR
jgi:tRNA splicing ligase